MYELFAVSVSAVGVLNLNCVVLVVVVVTYGRHIKVVGVENLSNA